MSDLSKPSINWNFLKPYWGLTSLLTFLVLVSNGLNLLIPRLLGQGIDLFSQATGDGVYNSVWGVVALLAGISILVTSITIIQTWLGVYISENIARDLRMSLMKVIMSQPIAFVQDRDPSVLFTQITSDTEAVKSSISQGLVSIFSAIIILVGSIILIFSIDIQLALIAIITLPIIGITFFFIFKNISSLFRASQETLEKINKIINESVLGAMLIRVLNSQQEENHKFYRVNTDARDIGYRIIGLFASLIPIINLVSNIAIVSIIWFGGRQVMVDDLTLGEFSAFISYFNLLITPIFILGFVSSSISRSLVSLSRIQEILDIPIPVHSQDMMVLEKEIQGKIEFQEVSLDIQGVSVLKNISFVIHPQTKNAIMGPTAGGKSLILSLMAGLLTPSSGEILIDDIPIAQWDKKHLAQSMGIVFQESIVFNTSIKQNIIFDQDIADTDLQKALDTASVTEIIETLPRGIHTQVSERGSNLSGGQKQRVMLARALVHTPQVVLLDDFTARVDIATEQTIIRNLFQNYPDITLISITQKIQPIQDYDQIIVIMEGELIGSGTHISLLEHSFEYQQIWQSQQTS
jgi:ATP-binding cassette subfamily B protein